MSVSGSKMPNNLTKSWRHVRDKGSPHLGLELFESPQDHHGAPRVAARQGLEQHPQHAAEVTALLPGTRESQHGGQQRDDIRSQGRVQEVQHLGQQRIHVATLAEDSLQASQGLAPTSDDPQRGAFCCRLGSFACNSAARLRTSMLPMRILEPTAPRPQRAVRTRTPSPPGTFHARGLLDKTAPLRLDGHGTQGQAARHVSWLPWLRLPAHLGATVPLDRVAHVAY